MKINRFLGIASLALALSSSCLSAQYYYPVTVSGFTHDVIANGVGNANASTTASVDVVDFAYVSRDFQTTSTSPVLGYGLPVTGQFMTVNTATPGLTYQLAGYTNNNALKLSAAADTGTLTFTTPTAAYSLFFLATGGSGSAVVGATVTFSDGTTQAFTNLTVSDWYDQPNFAIQGIGRINIVTNALEDGAGINPRIYQIPLAITAANQSKTVQSVSFSKTSGSGIVNIFGISADKYTTCLAPTAVTASAVTSNSATVTWTAPATVPSSYDVYYTSSTVAPSSTTTPSFTGLTTLTTPLSSLSSQTKYHIWIRSNCAGNVGAWAYGTTFTTPCTAFPVPYSENFDTTATGTSTNNNAPLCWSYLETSGFTGYGYVTTGNAFSPSNNYYLYNSSATTGNQLLVSPQTVSLSDGTKRVKFYAKAGGAGYTLQVGTLTNPSDPSTFVAFATTSLTTTQTVYKVNIPTGAGEYLAFRHNLGGSGRSIYLDDITVEAIPSCVEPTALVTSNASPTSVDLAWTPSSTGAASGYEYYYTAQSTMAPPTAATIASGTFPANSVSGVVSGLNANHTYYLWMRSVCSATNKSEWSYQTVFKTTCGPTPSLFEDFESYATGSIVPDCWARIYANGTQTISATSPASGIRNIYQTNSATQTPSVVVLPELSNVSAGTHRLRFKARVTVATGSLNVGYVTSTTDATTFVNIQTLSLANTSYASGAEYTVDVPNSVPANARLAIKNTADGKSYYWDDMVWENKNSLNTAETRVQKKLSIHPNPFKDVLYISETKDIKSVMIYDVAGRVVKQVNDGSSEIRVSELKEGMYLVKVNFKDGSQSVTKAIKK